MTKPLIMLRLLRLFLLILSFGSVFAQPIRVRIEPADTGFRLRVNERPYYINGFVGASQFALAKACGANSVRTGASGKNLDEAQQNGLTALTNLHIPGERDGMDWNDEGRKAALKEKLLAVVNELKDHPAVLIWVLGNELDWIPPGKPYNRKLWDFLNDVARDIHRLDPHHPVMTVVGTSELPQKFDELARQCPDVDLLGINAYADLGKACAQARQHWKRPYVVTEWGPDGHWEVPKTAWKAPLEQTSTEKAQSYRDRYQNVIQADREFCLGSYVFYWHHKQEITHTWYGMFDTEGNATEAVEAMSECWQGRLTPNRSPRLTSFYLIGQHDRRNILLKAGEAATANVAWQEPDGGPVTVAWEVRQEATYAAYAGQGEKEAQTMGKQTLPKAANSFSFMPPGQPGNYRLFVYLYDGKKHLTVANLPFQVVKQ